MIYIRKCAECLRMSFYIGDALLLIPQTISWSLSAQAFYQMLRTLWYFIWHLNDINAT